MDRTSSNADELPPDTPEQILKRRLARGEISPEEYRQLLETLNGESRHRLAA